MFSVLDMTDLCILCKMVALFSPTNSFTAWLTSAECPPRISKWCHTVSLGSQGFSRSIPTLMDHISVSSPFLSLGGYPSKDSSFQWLTPVSALRRLFWRRFCWPSPQFYLHKPVNPIMLAHSHSYMTVCRLGLWKPWRHFWNKFQVLQHLKEQDFKNCFMSRQILSLSECPTPRQYVPHTFGRFATHSAQDGTWHLKFLFPFSFGGIIWLLTSVGTSILLWRSNSVVVWQRARPDNR